MKKYRSELQRIAEANIRAEEFQQIPKIAFWYKASIVLGIAGWLALMLSYLNVWGY